MEKLAITLMAVIMALASIPYYINALEKGEFFKWAKSIQARKEKVTHLHFYFHDTLSGKSPTAIPVAQANTTPTSPTSFGLINMMDDPLTVGPDPNSKLLGRSQGLYGFSGQEELTLIMVTSFVFTEGEYNGSSLSILSHNPIMNPTREVAIVGGTGYFRLARGVAYLNTTFFDLTTRDAIVEYDVVVFHY